MLLFLSLGLNAGKYLGVKDLGKVTVDTHFDAKLAKSPIINLKNLFVREIEFKGYTYSDIEASGSFENNRLLLNAASVDPNLAAYLVEHVADPEVQYVTIDYVESLSGFNFFANVPAAIQNAAESTATPYNSF